tara:strand:+ start:287 stop:1036 length:750 start_codon:yes stop_codon:yes gene_type:complete
MKSKKNLKVLKVRDKSDNHAVKLPMLFDLPFRLLLIGKSGSGKSNLLINLLANENYPYEKLFNGDRIFIFSPSLKGDQKLLKLIDFKEIPDSNLFEEYSDELMLELYEEIVEDVSERYQEKEKVEPTLIILDDLSFSGKLANRFNALSKVYCNSRKFQVSIITLSQAYTQVAKNIRLQATGMIIFNTNNKELDTIESENNFLKSKKAFYSMFRSVVIERTDFLIINYSNDSKDLYLDKEFQIVDGNKYD